MPSTEAPPRHARGAARLAVVLAAWLSLAPAEAPVAGPVNWGREFAFDPSGALLTRHRLGDVPPAGEGESGAAGQAPEGTAFFPILGAATDTLWTDRVHLNSIPERVAITGSGDQALVGWWLNNPRASHYVLASGRVPNWVRPLVTTDLVPVCTPYHGTVFATTGEADSLYGIASAGGELYSERYPPGYLGGLVATCDSGTVVVSAAERGDSTRVMGHAPLTGDSLWARMLDETVNGLDLSSDGTTLAVTTDYRIYVYDGLLGLPIDTLSVPEGSPWPAAVSGDGFRIVSGGATPLVRLWQWAGVGPRYDGLWFFNTGATHVTSVDISDNGSRVLAGTFVQGPPTSGQLHVFDASSPTPLSTLSTFGDNVCDVTLDAAGEFGAAACWGRQGGTVGPILTVFHTDAPSPALFNIMDDQISVIRSFLDVEMADSGGKLIAAAKQVHARDLGNRGVVVAVDNPSAYAGVPAASWTPESAPLLEAWPNPAVAGTRFAWRAPAGAGPYRLRILDVTGRELRAFTVAGNAELAWDGRDAAGGAPAPGLYFYRLEGRGVALVRKLVIAR